MTGFMQGYQYPVGTTIDAGSVGPTELAPAPFDPAILLYSGGSWGYASPGGGVGVKTSYLAWTRDSRVPGGGTTFLAYGDRIIASNLGMLLPSGVTLKGITVVTNVLDAARDYEIQVVATPKTAPTLIAGATLALASGARSNDRRDLSLAIGKVEYGVRIIRTSGVGQSTFNRIGVVLEVELP